MYSDVKEKTSYRFIMEDNVFQVSRRHKRISHKGYVKLRSMDTIDTKLSVKSNSTSGFESGGNVDDGTENIYDSLSNEAIYGSSQRNLSGGSDQKQVCYIDGIPCSAASVSSTSRGSSEYDYTYITQFNAHKPLTSLVTHSDEPLSTTLLPSDCLTNEIMEDEDDEGEQSDGYTTDNEGVEDEKESTLKEEPIYMHVAQQYLNSKAFMKYFINIFHAELAGELHIGKDELEKASTKAASVYVPPYEIVPAIACPWPNEAFEWTCRPRTPVKHTFTQQECQWPTQDMIHKVVEFGCHIIPVGYAAKSGGNPNKELEWKIIFPLAERYLESCLSSAQIKVYMIMKALLKTFIDPHFENGTNMFTKDHLKTHLFWLCEQNYMSWDEDRLGEKLMYFISTLLTCITHSKLPDYFLKKRNRFENIPKKHLIHLHNRLTRIYERPVNHLLIALRNVKYQPLINVEEPRDFYPKMRYKKLYNFLIVKDALSIINPEAFAKKQEEAIELKKKLEEQSVSHKETAVSRTELERRKNRNKRRRSGMPRSKAPLPETCGKAGPLERMPSVESINIQVSFLVEFIQQ